MRPHSVCGPESTRDGHEWTQHPRHYEDYLEGNAYEYDNFICFIVKVHLALNA